MLQKEDIQKILDHPTDVPPEVWNRISSSLSPQQNIKNSFSFSRRRIIWSSAAAILLIAFTTWYFLAFQTESLRQTSQTFQPPNKTENSAQPNTFSESTPLPAPQKNPFENLRTQKELALSSTVDQKETLPNNNLEQEQSNPIAFNMPSTKVLGRSLVAPNPTLPNSSLAYNADKIKIPAPSVRGAALVKQELSMRKPFLFTRENGKLFPVSWKWMAQWQWGEWVQSGQASDVVIKLLYAAQPSAWMGALASTKKTTTTTEQTPSFQSIEQKIAGWEKKLEKSLYFPSTGNHLDLLELCEWLDQ